MIRNRYLRARHSVPRELGSGPGEPGPPLRSGPPAAWCSAAATRPESESGLGSERGTKPFGLSAHLRSNWHPPLADFLFAALDLGLEKIRQIFSDHDAEDHFETDELVRKLLEMKQSIVDEYAVEPSLTDQLAAAIADEHYELAAEIRDKIANFKPPEV